MYLYLLYFYVKILFYEKVCVPVGRWSTVMGFDLFARTCSWNFFKIPRIGCWLKGQLTRKSSNAIFWWNLINYVSMNILAKIFRTAS